MQSYRHLELSLPKLSWEHLHSQTSPPGLYFCCHQTWLTWLLYRPCTEHILPENKEIVAVYSPATGPYRRRVVRPNKNKHDFSLYITNPRPYIRNAQPFITLTHICLKDFSFHINLASLFPILGMSGTLTVSFLLYLATKKWRVLCYTLRTICASVRRSERPSVSASFPDS